MLSGKVTSGRNTKTLNQILVKLLTQNPLMTCKHEDQQHSNETNSQLNITSHSINRELKHVTEKIILCHSKILLKSDLIIDTNEIQPNSLGVTQMPIWTRGAK